MPHKRLGFAIALVGLVAIAVATLTPGDDFGAAGLPWYCVLCGELALTDTLVNLALFVPFSFGLRLAGLRWSTIVPVALVMTLCIELLQFRAIDGRDTSLRDVAANTMGAAVGSWLASNVAALWAPPRLALRLLIVWCTIWIALASVAAWALRLDPTPPPYGERPTPPFLGFTEFRGKVVDATIEGGPLRPGPLPNDRTIHDRLRAGSLDLRLRLVWGPEGELPAQIVGITGFREGLVVLAQSNDQAVLRLPFAGRRARLGIPTLSMVHMPATGRDTIELSIAATPGRVAMAERSAGPLADRLTVIHVSPLQSWTLFSPFGPELSDRSIWETRLWVAVLLAPCGYLAGLRRPRSPREWALVLIPIAGAVAMSHLVIPALSGLSRATFGETVAAVVGVAVGWGIGQFGVRAAERTSLGVR